VQTVLQIFAQRRGFCFVRAALAKISKKSRKSLDIFPRFGYNNEALDAWRRAQS
jgi:hypothetical protein